jgi:hypothetical protein
VEFLAAVVNSFLNGNDISGDYATMAVTEGAVPAGCGYEKDIGSLALDTDVYRQLRVRLRGRDTTPQYKIGIEYTDTSIDDTGWVNAPTSFGIVTLQLDAAKVVHKVQLYAKCNTAFCSAQIDYDYAVLQCQFPIVPYEHYEVDVDLQHTLSCSGFRIRAHHDKLHGVTALRYRFDENMGVVATDLGSSKLNGTLVNAPTWAAGKYNYCLQFAGAERVDTGYFPIIAATGALTIVFRIKGSSGDSGIIMGSGKATGTWNRVQLILPGADKIRIYVKDDAGNILQYTSTAVVLDDTWHHIAAVVNPNDDVVDLYIDGEYDGQDTGALGVISLDDWDFTIGCLHNEAGYSTYVTCYVDEPAFYTKDLTAAEIKEHYLREPASGVSRVPTGAWAMIYIADQSESLIYKILKGRVIDRATGGDADQPWIEFTGEDQAEIIQERSWSRNIGVATQISAVASYVIDDSVDELFKDIATTNRTIINKFRNENCWSVLQKLAESATFATGEKGANFFVDPGGCFRFRKYGGFSCPERITDGSDGYVKNILDIQVKESIKITPKMANDVKVIIFEEEYIPSDQDAWTESAGGWSSPDPLDVGYPQSDAGDKTTGTASIAFNVTLAGTQVRMRVDFGETDLTKFDELRFDLKYGATLTIDTFRVQMLKLGTWGVTSDYFEESGIAPPGSAAWYEITISIPGMLAVGNPGNSVNSLEIRAEQAAAIGTGGFRIDNLRFIRIEKSASHSDATSQANYGKRTLTVVDKNISNLTWAGDVADNIVENRKYPITTIQAKVKGMAQLGYRPPQKVTVTSLKDELNQQIFQIVRAQHRLKVGEPYVVDLDLIAAKTSISPPAYSALVGPARGDLETVLTEWRKKTTQEALYPLRTQYE